MHSYTRTFDLGMGVLYFIWAHFPRDETVPPKKPTAVRRWAILTVCMLTLWLTDGTVRNQTCLDWPSAQRPKERAQTAQHRPRERPHEPDLPRVR